MTHAFHSKFKLGDRVNIDGDHGIRAVVIGIAFYTHEETIMCEWFNNGAHQREWIENWRLEKVS